MTEPWKLPDDAVGVTEDDKFEFVVQNKLRNYYADQKVRAILRGDVPKALDRWLDEDALAALPDPGWLVEGLLPDVGLSLLVGEPGSMKSLLALSVAGAMVSGSPFLGRQTVAAPVVYVAAEGLRGTKKRWLAQRRRMWRDEVTLQHGIQFDTMLDLLDDETVKDFSDAVVTVRAKLVVVDTLARCAVGMNENSSQDMGRVVRNLDRIAQAGECSVLLLHHSAKGADGDAVRGSSALKGAADAVLQTVSKGRGLTTVKTIKQKDDEPAQDFYVAFSPIEGSDSGVLDHPTLAQSAALAAQFEDQRLDVVLTMIRSSPGLRQQALIEGTGLPKATVVREVNRLIRTGEVIAERVGRGVFYFPGEAKS